ncbi:ATP-binding protein [Streptomyces viridiviolaceus]|uniref:ATP-binding protein n=1 Tax=Streptomyces viridiviolaceus TaxID=68282 RepID=A0ABW2EBE9_9ACTN
MEGLAQTASRPLRPRAARFPARKSLENFDFDHQRSSNARSSPPRDTRLRRLQGECDLPGPAGTGKTHLATGLVVLLGTRASSFGTLDQVCRRGGIFEIVGDSRHRHGLMPWASCVVARAAAKGWPR